MSTQANPKGKGGKAPASANNDADSIMPLLFATIGNPSISFKKMAAMDELGRTESSLEHRFRKWRQKGREIAAENPENAGSLSTTSTANTPKKPSAPSKKGGNGKGKGPAKQAYNADDELDNVEEKAGVIKQEPNKMAGIDGEMSNPSTKEKAAAIGGSKKRAASEAVAAAERHGSETPAKKAKVVKKGIAKIVKKPSAKAYCGSEEEDAVSEDKEEVPLKPKGKGNVNAAATKGKGKAKKGKADVTAKAGQISSHLDENGDAEMDGGDTLHDGMMDMQFDEAG